MLSSITRKRCQLQDLSKYTVPTSLLGLGMPIPAEFEGTQWGNRLFSQMLWECLLLCLTQYAYLILNGNSHKPCQNTVCFDKSCVSVSLAKTCEEG